MMQLVSHALCPYVQRAAIVLAEKGVPFERIDIDLADKPDWFRALSPLGRVPLLRVDGQTLFESSVICEYLEDTHGPSLHPADPLPRARHRAWMAFGSEMLDAIAAFYNAPDETALAARRDVLRERWQRVEAELAGRDGPWFGGARFSIVDAVFAPVFRYFDTFERIGAFGFFDGLPRVTAWRQALSERPSVRDAVSAAYPEGLRMHLLKRGSALSRRMA